MNDKEDKDTKDFVSGEGKNLFTKFLLSLLGVVVMVIGELVKNDDDLKKW